MKSTFPEVVRSLPRADIPFEGVTAYLSQGEGQQTVFMEFERDVKVPAHTHAAQWGVALAGRVDLTIDGVEHAYTAGDHYFIPAGVEHSARIHAGYAAMELYDEPARWSVMEAAGENDSSTS